MVMLDRHPKEPKGAYLFRMMLAAVLVGGGLMHMWVHSTWGQHDLTTIAVIALGLITAGSRDIIKAIKAVRGMSDTTSDSDSDSVSDG